MQRTDRQIITGRPGIGRVQGGDVAGRQLETALAFLPGLGNPFRIGSGKQGAGFIRIHLPVVRLHPDHPSILFRHPENPAPSAFATGVPGFPECFQPQVDARFRRLLCQRILLFQEGGDIGRKGLLGRRFRPDQHLHDARMAWEGGEFPAVRCQPAIGAHRFQGNQQLMRLLQGIRRRRSKPAKPLRTGFSPGGDIQHRRRQIRLQNLGNTQRGHLLFDTGIPQPDAHARRHAAGASRPLVRHVPADADRFQAAQSALLVIYQLPAKAAVHDDPDPFDRQGCFGDGRRKDDFPLPCSTGRNGPALLRQGQHSIKRTDGRAAQGRSQQLRAAADIGLAGEEGEDISLIGPVGLPHRIGHGFGGIFRGGVGPADDLHREHLPPAFYQRRIQFPAQRIRVDGGRHQENSQVGPQHLLRLARKREGHIGGQAPLVELVENDHGNAIQPRIVHEPAHEDAFREHLDTGKSRYLLLEPHPVPDRPADRLSQHVSHPLGDLPGGHPPWLQHQHFPFDPFQDGQREQRGLAGARRRGNDHRSPRRQGAVHVSSDSGYRKILRIGVECIHLLVSYLQQIAWLK